MAGILTSGRIVSQSERTDRPIEAAFGVGIQGECAVCRVFTGGSVGKQHS